jgi:hypothetical protein
MEDNNEKQENEEEFQIRFDLEIRIGIWSVTGF